MVGTQWVMDIYDTVKFDTPLGLDSINPNYCPKFLYWFSFRMWNDHAKRQREKNEQPWGKKPKLAL